jgi:hypothetical protein
VHPDGENEGGSEEQPDSRPYLCIPYWTTPITDNGRWDIGRQRALPSQVVSYACESIHPGPYVPGTPLDVVIDVRNSGGGNGAAVATVVVYWADPTVGFAKPNFFAAATVAVPPNRMGPEVVSTGTMTAVIPASAPPHVCLLAVVSHPQDRAGKVADPINDRHWAQRNLLAVAGAPGAPVIVPFSAANPRLGPELLQLRAGQVDDERARAAAAAVGTSPADTAVTVRLLDEHGAALTGAGPIAAVALELAGLERREFQLLVEVEGDIAPGTSVGVEILGITRDGEGETVGSLGVAVVSDKDG